MIAFVRTINIKPGQTLPAMKFAREIATYAQAHQQLTLEVLRPVGGNPQRLAWSARFADLAAYEATMNRMTSDPKYWELVNGAAEAFIGGSAYDSLWQTT